MQILIFIETIVTITLVGASEVLQEFAVGNREFTADVYGELLKSERGNFLVCPLSAEIILSLVHAGAGGETARQLAAGLHLPENKEKTQQIIQELTPYLHGNENYTLSTANKVYVKNGFKIKDQFKSTAVNVYEADIENIEFEKTEQAASEINRWVGEKTYKKINSLIRSRDLNNHTRAVLINAIYFHGKWAAPFEKEATTKKTFYVNHRKAVQVDMMEKFAHLKYHESDHLNAKFLELDYAGSNVTMTFVLPNDKEGLPALEARVKDVLLPPEYYRSEVHVVLPKFKIETKIEFNDILETLGITEAFSDNANFDGILVNQPLKIDKVVQKAFIEVEEEGTTAAAATAVLTVVPISIPPPPMEFIADHPFIFYLKVKDVVLFAGRYNSPEN